MERFLKILEELLQRLLGIILKPKDLLDDRESNSVKETLVKIFDALEKMVDKVVPGGLTKSYENGLKQAAEDLKAAGMNKLVITGVSFFIHKEAVSAINDDTILDLKAAIRTAKENAIQSIDQTLAEVKEDIKTGVILGDTRKIVSQRVASAFAKKGLTSFVTKDGKNLPLDFYARTVVKTKTRQAHTTGAVNRYNENDVHLVKIDEHHPTCHVCARYQGLVVSLTGNQDGFPNVKEVPLPPYHPNCEHTIRPFVIEFKSQEEIRAERDRWERYDSEKDIRSKAQQKAYEKEQQIRRVANQEKKQYAKLRAALGDKAPKTIGAYRRMKRKNDVKWKKLQSEYRSAVKSM